MLFCCGLQSHRSLRGSSPQSGFIPPNQRVAVLSNQSDLKPGRGGGGRGGGPLGPPERQLTFMLVGVCLAFVCLRLPYTTSYALYEYTKQPNSTRSAEDDLPYHVAKQITDVIATTNYMVNFFLYGLCGSYFRQQIRAAFHCGKGRWAAGRQHQYGSGSGSGYSKRTSLTMTTRASVVSDTMQLNTCRPPSRELKLLKVSVEP